MRNVRQKAIALLLCLVLMTSLLTACGKKEDTTQTGNDVQTENTDNTTGTDEKDDGEDTSETTEPVSDVLTELTLPLTEEKEELSVWTLYLNAYVTDPNELAGAKKMEELTNVHINWVTVGYQEIAEKFGLMIASGDIADIIYAAAMASYPGGAEKAVEDGIYMDCTELVEKYMPNYRELRTSTPQLAKDTMTDSGKLIGIYGLQSSNTDLMEALREWTGMAVRKDILDSWGVETIPETIEEWHDLLVIAKENGMDAPLLTGPKGYSATAAFMSAYGILPEFYQEDGVVKFGPAEPGYKEWVQLFRDWYAEGLIDPNFNSTMAESFSDPAYILGGRTIAFPTLQMFTADGFFATGYSPDENINILGVPNPVLNKGDEPLNLATGGDVCGNPTYISADCENPELAAKWLDYQMTLEGMYLNFYGVEGESYEIVDGDIVLTDVVMNNPDYPTPSEALSVYARGNGLGRFAALSADYSTIGSEKYDVAEITWTEQDASKVIPTTVAMTDEEANAFTTTYTAVQTLVNEMTVKFIMGTESMDNYDAFVESLYTYGLEECIGYKQAALDRYNSRGN